MNKVYFSSDLNKLLEQIDFDLLGEKVAIKLHFGEKGCNTFLDPAIAHAIYDKVVSFGKEANLVESNVLYKGSRTIATDHIRTAREHGFDRPIRPSHSFPPVPATVSRQGTVATPSHQNILKIVN